MRKRSVGFTFVELMLAASILAIVALAIYSTFGAGLSAWRKTEKVQDLYQDIRLALERITGDLENVVFFAEKYAEEDFINFVGEKNRISFYSMVDVFGQMPAHPEVKKITYSLEDSVLQRLEQTFPESVQEIQEQRPEELAAQINNLNFLYCYEVKDAQPPYEWRDAWDVEDSFPQGVKIELELEAEEELVFTKYVFIPIGEKGPE